MAPATCAMPTMSSLVLLLGLAVARPRDGRRLLDWKDPCNEGNVLTFDKTHEKFTQVLTSHVQTDSVLAGIKTSLVDYEKLRADPSQLWDYQRQLCNVDLQALSQEDQVALFCNAYNALMISIIVQFDPPESVRELESDPAGSIWKQKLGTVGGIPVSLDDLEHHFVRGDLSAALDAQGLVHSCFVCGSLSCPSLQPVAFQGEGIIGQLTNITQRWLNNPSKNPGPNADGLQLSKYFDWYGQDFAKQEGSIAAYVRKYTEWKISDGVAISFLPYNWDLNAVNGSGTFPPSRSTTAVEEYSVVSAASLAQDGSKVTATCHSGQWVQKCESVPPNAEDGVLANADGTSCTAGSNGGVIKAKATCGRTESSIASSGDMYLDNQTISVTCASGLSAVSCSCATAWAIGACNGISEFVPKGGECRMNAPTSSGRRRGTEAGAGVIITAICQECSTFTDSSVCPTERCLWTGSTCMAVCAADTRFDCAARLSAGCCANDVDSFPCTSGYTKSVCETTCHGEIGCQPPFPTPIPTQSFALSPTPSPTQEPCLCNVVTGLGGTCTKYNHDKLWCYVNQGACPDEVAGAKYYWSESPCKRKAQYALYQAAVECGSESYNFGDVATLELCAQQVVTRAGCGPQFMFSADYTIWGCRCCRVDGADGGRSHVHWNLYTATLLELAPSPAPPTPTHPTLSLSYQLHEAAIGCGAEYKNLGDIATPELCAQQVVAHTGCGPQFMFGKYTSWGCRCCTVDGADGGKSNVNWNLYTATGWQPALACVWVGKNPSKLEVCQGDCDNDAECPGSSVCVQRTGGSPAAVEGCDTGDSAEPARADTDYCSNPPALACKFIGASPSKLEVCQGDCDKDAECPGSSVCVQRKGGSPAAVEGCDTGDSAEPARAETDYCSNPLALACVFIGANPSKLEVCQGDCDRDAECPGSSVCVQRKGGSPAAVEGCDTGDSAEPARVETDYCSNPQACSTWQVEPDSFYSCSDCGNVTCCAGFELKGAVDGSRMQCVEISFGHYPHSCLTCQQAPPIAPTSVIKRCASFSCPSDYMPKVGATDIVGDELVACCDRTCSSFKCHGRSFLIQNHSGVAGDDADTCCVKCTAFDCPDNYTLKLTDSSLGKRVATTLPGFCCDPSCSGFACPHTYRPKTGAAGIAGNAVGPCCDKLCTGYACPIGFATKVEASIIIGNSQETCCEDADEALTSTSTRDSAFPLAMVAIMCGGCVLIGFLACLVVCLYRRRASSGAAAYVSNNVVINYTTIHHLFGGSGADLHAKISPSKWCVNTDQFFKFLDEVDTRFIHEDPRCYDVVERLVKPQTQACDCSYALMLNPSGIRATLYIVHAWGGGAFGLCGALRNALGKYPCEGIWICLLSMPVAWEESRLGELLGTTPYSSPFYIALTSVSAVLAVRTPGVNIYARLWCVFELWASRELGKDVVTLGRMDEHTETLNFGCRATCTFQRDTDMLSAALSKHEGAVDTYITKLRSIGVDVAPSSRANALALSSQNAVDVAFSIGGMESMKDSDTLPLKRGATTAARPLPDGKLYHFFMSHKKFHSSLGNISASLALAIHDALVFKGFVGFYDVDDLEEISKKELEDAVKASCAMLVCLTDETCQSEWCRFEWEIADKYNIPAKGIVDLQNFHKSKIIQQVQQTSPHILNYQLAEYTEKTRKDLIRGVADWLEKRMDDLEAGVGPGEDVEIANQPCHSLSDETFISLHPVSYGSSKVSL